MPTTIKCEYCGTEAPPANGLDDAIYAAIKDGFTEIEKRKSGAVVKTFFLCDVCHYMNKEFTDPQKWEPKKDAAMYKQETLQIDTDEAQPRQPALLVLPEQEKQGFRIAQLGPQACSQHELIASIIGGTNQTEIALALISKIGDLRTIYNANPDHLAEKVPGLTRNMAIRLKAALDIGRRMTVQPAIERTQINSPADIADMVRHEMQLLEKEELWVLNLDRRNRVMELSKMYKGSVSSSQVRIGEVFKPAICIDASAIVPVHNHPSGDPFPSPDDVALTRALVQAGKLLNIDVLDHLIIGANNWVSLKERGL